jgi:hypothetical protein
LRILLTTQLLSALQLSELSRPLQNLALVLYWSSRAFGGPLATIFSGLPVMDKVGAVLTVLAPPVISVVEVDALSLFLQSVVYGLDLSLGR